MYCVLKMLKFFTGSSAKSYQIKFGVNQVLLNWTPASEDIAAAIKDVMNYKTIRGTFSSVHPDLEAEGFIRVEVGEEGLHFVRRQQKVSGDTLLISLY